MASCAGPAAGDPQGRLAAFQPGQHAGEQVATVLGLDLRQGVHPQGIAVAQVGEEQQGFLRVRLEQEAGALRRVLGSFQGRFAVELGGHALELPAVGEGHHGFLRRGGLLGELRLGVVRGLQHGAAVVPVFGGDGLQLLLDDPQELLFALRRWPPAGESASAGPRIPCFRASNLQVGQPLQAHVQDGLRLRVVQLEAGHEALPWPPWGSCWRGSGR